MQYRDEAGNMSAVVSDEYVVDDVAPQVTLEVQAGESSTRGVHVMAFDAMSDLAQIHASADSRMQSVSTMQYTPQIDWTFADEGIVWISVEDRVGNVSEPVPAFIDNGDEDDEDPVVDDEPFRIFAPIITRQ